MDSLIQFIIGNATTFTPACMVGVSVLLPITFLKMGGDQLGISGTVSIYSNDVF